MRVAVDGGRLRAAADETDRAAAAVSAASTVASMSDLAAAVAVAMPGSRSSALARRVAAELDRATRCHATDLGATADALRVAAARYGDTEAAVATAAREALGAA